MSLTALQASAYLHHLHFTTPQPERLAAFYGEAMDMNLEVLSDGLWLAMGPARRVLFTAGEAKRLECAGFAVRDAEALTGLRELAEEMELQPRTVASRLFQPEAFFVTDPDGNVLHFGLAPVSTAMPKGIRGPIQHLTLASRDIEAIESFYSCPRNSTALDYEGELAVVIGRSGFRVKEEEALGLVSGFAIFNDATLRDWQRHTPQFTPGKNFPRTGAFGPSLLTREEAGALEEKRIETRLNGTVMQEAKLGDMIFSISRIIAYLTAFTRLSAGDVIATGTPGGVGFKREPQVFMKDGDRVEVTIDGLGTLVNTIEQEPEPDSNHVGN